MFDKLIETEPKGANFHNRRSYFMVSSIVVGVLFITAVVISIYASDYGLGRDSFELSTIVAPPEITAEPAMERPQPNSGSNRLPTRQVNMLNLNESPKAVPSISTVPNSQQARPDLSRFVIGRLDSNADNTDGRDYRSGRDGEGTGQSGLSSSNEPAEPSSIPEPPTIKKPVETKPRVVRSEGPINGKAIYLPKPPYPAAAVAMNIQGKVDVQVLIDETGKVISANAVNGHAFLRVAAERAAWNAKFSPTYLSKVPVKVTGVIVYNFTK